MTLTDLSATSTSELATKDIETKYLGIVLPFPGFYASWLDKLVNEAFESVVAYKGTRMISLDEEILDVLRDHCDFRKVMELVGRLYTNAFQEACEQSPLGTLRLIFDAVNSPKEYNFKTDRLFAKIDIKIAKQVFDISKSNKHRCLASILKEECTSTDGFISWYSPDVKKHLAMPIEAWDHNQLNWLLRAALNVVSIDLDDVEHGIRQEFETAGLVEPVAKSINWENVWSDLD